MTNRDLIEKLKQFDPDDEVMILGIGNAFDSINYQIINVENASCGGRVIDLVVCAGHR